MRYGRWAEQMSRRKEQLESSLRKALGVVLSSGLADPRIRGLITVTGVRVSDDRKRAVIGISVLPEEQGELTVHGLKAARVHIQTEVSGKLRARSLPEFVFQLDGSLKKQAEVLGAIREAGEVTDFEADAEDAADAGVADEGEER